MGFRGLRGLQQRVEATRAGRWLISLFVVGTLLALLVANLPDGRVQVRAERVAQPYLLATGLDQRWKIFGPVPRSVIYYLEARVLRADGSVSIWKPPSNDPAIGAFRDERWRKYVEHAVVRPDEIGWPVLWEPLARYAARQEAAHGPRPVKVTLVKRSALEIPPGKGPPYLTRWVETPYYTLTLGR